MNFYIYLLFILAFYSFNAKAQEVQPPVIDLEKALQDYDERGKYQWHSEKYKDSNKCLIARPSHFSNADILNDLEINNYFILAVKNYEDEYMSARFSQLYIDIKMWSIEDEITSLKAEGSNPEKKKRIRHWLNTEHLCLQKIKPYSVTTKNLLVKSAKQGYEPAMTALSVVYENAIGTEMNLIEAYAWRGVSVALHRPFGQDKLDELARQLDPFELNKAEDLSFQYQKKYTKLFDQPTGVIWNK